MLLDDKSHQLALPVWVFGWSTAWEQSQGRIGVKTFGSRDYARYDAEFTLILLIKTRLSQQTTLNEISRLTEIAVQKSLKA